MLCMCLSCHNAEGSLGEDRAVLVCLCLERTVAGDSCRVGRPGSMPMGGAAGASSRRGRRLAATLFNKITDAGVSVSSLSTRILLRRTACAAPGLAGPLVHRHFFQNVPPAHARLGIQRQDGATPPTAGPAQPLPLWPGGRRLELLWLPDRVDNMDFFI